MTTPAALGLAVGLTGAAVALAMPGGTVRVSGTAGGARSLPRAALLLVAVVAGLELWSVLSAKRFALIVLLTSAGVVVGRIVRRRRAAQAAERRSELVLAVCDALASDLAAGQPPLSSLERAAAEWPDFAPVAAAGRMGADVPGVLRELATAPGARQLRTLAATWQVAHDTGSGLAGAIGQAAEAIRADRRTSRLVASELAAARATARLLAVLPLGVLLLGKGIGGDPVGFLTGSVPGLACLGSGLGLCLAGLLWLEHIADRVLHR